jgi:hypothetical protein
MESDGQLNTMVVEERAWDMGDLPIVIVLFSR